MIILYIYLILINIVGFSLMCIDKYKACNRQWRIPEQVLFGAALLGGSLGSIVGMWWVRHKTRHWYFVIGMPTILILQILVFGVWIPKLFG